jgi:dihydroorotase
MLPENPRNLLMLLIKSGRVLDPASKTDASLDILLDGERIAEIAPATKITLANGVEVFDASGLIVAPGFIDMHVHLREPGQENSETIETGTRAAARGGFTAVCCMPNTRPVNDNASITRFIVDRAKAHGHVRVWPIGAVSVGSRGEDISDIAAMREAGIVAVSDDGKPIATAKLARQVMEYCRTLDLPVIEHAEDVSLAAGAVMREGIASTRLGLPGMPAAAESVCVARDVQLAGLTGARLHIAHLSARASLEQVRFAKQNGLRVSCEVTPHHFTLIDEDVTYDSHYKMNPPLAAREDREALVQGLTDGTVDAIATDHAPHEPALKDVEFDKSPFGILGCETALGLALEQLVHTGKIKLMRMVELFTTGPARVLGKERKLAVNEPADLTIFSLDRPWIYNVKDSASKSRNSPFDGKSFKGGPVATIVAGKIVHRA